MESSNLKPLPKLAVLLGLLIAGFAIFALFRDLWHLTQTGTAFKELRTGGGIGINKSYAIEISGTAAWLQVMGETGLVATGLSAVIPWLRKRFWYVFPTTVIILAASTYLSK